MFSISDKFGGDWSVYYITGNVIPPRELSTQAEEFTAATQSSSNELIDWLVSLFNGISTLFRLFNAKAILLEEQ